MCAFPKWLLTVSHSDIIRLNSMRKMRWAVKRETLVKIDCQCDGDRTTPKSQWLIRTEVIFVLF